MRRIHETSITGKKFGSRSHTFNDRSSRKVEMYVFCDDDKENI